MSIFKLRCRTDYYQSQASLDRLVCWAGYSFCELNPELGYFDLNYKYSYINLRDYSRLACSALDHLICILHEPEIANQLLSMEGIEA